MSFAQPDGVSVVIPSHNRCASLRRTLDALASQTYPSSGTEVIVVADGCDDDTAAMVSGYRAPYALHLAEQAGLGAGVARNNGAARASKPLLLFLDDDIEPGPRLIEAHVAAHATGEAGLSLGPSWPALSGRLDFFRMELRAWWLDFFGALRRPSYRFAYRSFAAGNCAIDADLFARLSGFDARIRSCGGEDWEFGVRLIKAQVPFTYVHAAEAKHHDSSDLIKSLERKRQEGRADVVIGGRHPEVRASLALARFETSGSRLARALRRMSFSFPGIGDAAVSLLGRLMPMLERLRLRRPWRGLLGRLNDYWYWRGVADELGSRRALGVFLQGGTPVTGREIELDLCHGLHSAELRLDAERPQSARLHYRGQAVGRVPPEPGAESLRGAHLRNLLATVLADQLLSVLAVQAATGLPIHPEWLPLTSSSAFLAVAPTIAD